MSDLVIKLILIAAVAGGLLWAAYGVVSHFENRGRVKEAAVWQPKLAAAEANILKARAEAEGARADLERLRQEYQAQGEAVAKLTAEADARQAQVKKLLADIQANSRRYQAEVERLTGIAMGPPTKPETNCADADRVLRDLALARLRIHNP